MKQAAIYISIFIVFTAAASAVAGWPFSAAASLGAVAIAAAWVTGHHLIEPCKAWLEWKRLEQDAMEHQRRVHDFEELFQDIVDHGEPRSREEVWGLLGRWNALPMEESVRRLGLGHLGVVLDAYPGAVRGGWMIRVTLSGYPNRNPAQLPDNYDGIPFYYRVEQEQDTAA